MDTKHLGQLLVGIARSQRALAKVITKNDRGALNEIISSLQTEGQVRGQQQPTLADLPSRLLLHLVAGSQTNLEGWIHEELERLTK